MATYREIKGLSIPYLDSDYPSSVAATQEGQVWYNTTTNVLKGFGAVGAIGWSAGGDLNTARYQLGGAGSGNNAGTANTGGGGGGTGAGGKGIVIMRYKFQ